MQEEFCVVRARGEDVLLRLLRMLREGRIEMKPLNRMGDDALYRQVSIWFDPTSTASVFTFEPTRKKGSPVNLTGDPLEARGHLVSLHGRST